MRLENISFSYNGSEKIFDNVNFTLEYGDFVLLSGVSGEGKSTLLSIINGMIPFITPGKLEGKIYINSEDVTAVRVSERAKLIGTVLQNADEQIVYDTVRDEIAFGCENLDVPVEKIDFRIAASTNMMKISPDAKTRTMSGGQKQKVAVASVIALKPRVLVLDEPTAELDPASSLAVFELLKRYARENGTTVIVVEQKIALLSDFADMLLIVDGGKVRFQGTPAEVLEHSDELLEIGVNCPRSTSLVNRLRARGLASSPAVRNVDEAVKVCKQVLGGEGVSA